MHFSSTTVAMGLLGLASHLVPVAQAHMMMATPIPYGVDSLNNSPLDASGADFPCKQRAGVYDITQENKLSAGVDNTLSFTGSAVHGGGSCQLSLTKDREPTAKSSFKVIISYEGGCPGVDGPANFTYQIPKDSVPNGQYALAWTWFNKIGNREMYMNCAPVTVAGSAGTDDTFNALPEMFVANVGNGCSDTETTDLQFPNPGKVVVKGASATLAPPTGSNCAAPSGASQEPAAQATASTGGSSGSGGDSGSSGSSGSGGSGADNTGQCTGSCLGGGASGGSDGSSGSGSGSGAASPAAASSGSASSASAASSPAPAASTASPAASSNTGGVFAPGASGAATTAAGVTETPVSPPAATSESASSTSTLTTLMTITSGAGSDAGSTQAPAAPIPSAPAPAPAGNGSGSGSAPSSAAPAAPPAPAGSGTAGSSPGTASGSTCTTPGAVVCNGASQFGICNVDNTVVWQQVAAGTTCSNGQITKRDLAYHVHGGPRRNFFGW